MDTLFSSASCCRTESCLVVMPRHWHLQRPRVREKGKIGGEGHLPCARTCWGPGSPYCSACPCARYALLSVPRGWCSPQVTSSTGSVTPQVLLWGSYSVRSPTYILAISSGHFSVGSPVWAPAPCPGSAVDLRKYDLHETNVSCWWKKK